MFSKISSIANLGIDAVEVGVEVNVVAKKPSSFSIVGLPTKVVKESKERVQLAVSNSKLNFPERCVIINLAPADIPKEGSYYDLPIAIGILSLTMNFVVPESSLFFGEVSLDGSLKHTKGALLLALFAKENGFKQIFLPKASANEAAAVKGVDVYPVESISQLVYFLKGEASIETANYRERKHFTPPTFDMGEVLGQETAKRALEIAASGGHNIFMVGSPGSGKTMLARAIPGILPPLTQEESLQVTKIYSVSGNTLPEGSLITQRPFRAPHHSISLVGLIGGGGKPRPGEVTLAHRGVLFLDEFNEFQRGTVEALRQPLEDGFVSIVRARERVVYPSSYIFVASANPCPCGYRNHKKKECSCTERDVTRYYKKISGPILDRIDVCINVPDVDTEKLAFSSEYQKGVESSAVIRKRVEASRQLQIERFRGSGIMCNGEMRNREISSFAKMSFSAERVLVTASKMFNFSARSYYKVIKLARTIADIDQSTNIKDNHIKEAVQYRLFNN